MLNVFPLFQREGLVEAGVMTAKTHSGDEKEKEGNGVSICVDVQRFRTFDLF